MMRRALWKPEPYVNHPKKGWAVWVYLHKVKRVIAVSANPVELV